MTTESPIYSSYSQIIEKPEQQSIHTDASAWAVTDHGRIRAKAADTLSKQHICWINKLKIKKARQIFSPLNLFRFLIHV
jgi:hypothetical protein